MKGVTLKYYIYEGRDLKLQELNVVIKTDWNEVDEMDLLAFTDLRSMLVKKLITGRDFMASLVFHFLGVEEKIFRKLRGAEVEFVFQHLQFLFEEPKMHTILVKCFNAGITTFYGPDSELNFVTIGEYFSAEDYFRKYMESLKDLTPERGAEPSDLDRLIATLYRPASAISFFKKDRRCSFADYDANKWLRKVSRLPNHLKQAILLNYRGYRNFIAEIFPEVFKAQASDAGGEASSYLSVLLSLCGTTFGTLKETQTECMWPVLVYMNDAALQRKKMEAEKEKRKAV